MNHKELVLLQAVLPYGYEFIGSSPDGPCLWNGDHEWQLPLAEFNSATEVINKIIACEKAWAFDNGQAKVRFALKKLLEIPPDIEGLVERTIKLART